MEDYKNYLAENILSGDKVITYRFLSRALKVHVNIAKQMLYDFHKSHNAKHPGAVHATYLLYGSKQPNEGRSQTQASDDGDIEMASSMPENESDTEAVPTLTLSLVPEEQLEAIAAMYDEITSVHVYSLGPHPMKDPALLSDAAHELFTLPAATDSSGVPRTYGAISNPRVRRRERQGPVRNLAASNAPQPAARTAAKPPAKVKEEPKVTQQTLSKATKAAPSIAGFLQKKSVPSLKRGGSSGIMESFAKGAAAAAAAKAKKAETSQPATPSGDDSSMHPMSDGEEDDSKVLPQPKVHEGAGRTTKKDNQEALRRMMDDDDDDDEPDEDEPEEQEPSEAEETMEDSPAPEPKKEEPAEVVSTSGGGRRRGKRRIMTKKQTLDDKGYLVTVQEPGWESFSEDEAPPPPPISRPKPASSAPAAKPKKVAPKTGQGNIMSFFSKK